jgi:hypothetical protein
MRLFFSLKRTYIASKRMAKLSGATYMELHNMPCRLHIGRCLTQTTKLSYNVSWVLVPFSSTLLDHRVYKIQSNILLWADDTHSRHIEAQVLTSAPELV